MQGRNIAVMLVVAALLVGVAAAEDFSGTTVVIPVVMHGPGREGTAWVTDVWIGNRSSVDKTIELRFFPTSGAAVSTTMAVGAYSVLELQDVVLTTFGYADAKGLLILSTEGTSTFNAQARIYNAGNPMGEFGQFVPGFALYELGRQAYVYGVSGVDGNRTNIGIANPTDMTFDVNISLASASNESVASGTLTLSPKEVVQINDIFSYFGVAPGDSMQLSIVSGDGANKIYGYASVVQSGTGDAIFLPGLAVNTGPH